jgi:hypothetical protein
VARRRRPAVALAALALLAAPLAPGAPAHARDGGDRVEERVEGVCGASSSFRLRARGDGEEIRVDARVRTSRRGVWRVSLFHERRLVVRARVRATRSRRGFDYRATLPDYGGPDAVRMRAVAPSGESCAASATLSGSPDDSSGPGS